MQRDEILGLARHALTVAGGYLIHRGMASAEEVETGAGAIVALAGVIWSVWEKRQRAQ